MFNGFFITILFSLLYFKTFIVCENNYLLEKPCSFDNDSFIWECNLIFNQKNLINSTFVNTTIIPNSENGKIISAEKLIKRLKFQASNLANDVTHIKIFDAEKTRYEIPRNTIEYFEKETSNLNFTKKNLDCLTTVKENEMFKFPYLKDNGNETLFEMLSEDFLFMNDFIGFSYLLNTNEIFGYGERSTDFRLKSGVYTIWPRDTPNSFDDGKGAKNSYGHQPFFMNRNKKNSYVGFAFLNSNAQDLVVKEKNKENNKTQITQISIGGIIELLILSDESPQGLIRKLHNIIGKPVLPSFWALGWHQSRWGYKNTKILQNVVDKYNENKIPIDTIWSDIDYMQNYEDFGYDKINFEKLPDFVSNIKTKLDMHYVPIIDMGIPFNKDNYHYKIGKELDIYIKSNYTKDDLLNKVWPGVCVFPDFTSYYKAKIFWHQGLSILNNLIEYDGIWLDMNEPSGFVKGEIAENKTSENNIYFDPTYIPGGNRSNYQIDNSSLSINALMSKEYQPFNTIYNLKPLNVFYENKITYEYFTLKDKRPFILSRSSFLGMGRYTSHWLGDNMSFWGNMTVSIAGIFNFQMFGFNLVGADICGLMYDVDDDLCARWTALGAFYPFSRNHNNYTSIDQEPYNLGK